MLDRRTPSSNAETPASRAASGVATGDLRAVTVAELAVVSMILVHDCVNVTQKWCGSVFLFVVVIWIIHHQMRPSVTKADDTLSTAAVRFPSFPPPTPAEASAVTRQYPSWMNSAMRPTGGINRSEPLLCLVKPLDAELETLTPKCVGPSTPVRTPRGKPSTSAKIVFLKLRKVMAEANCVWWITNGGPIAHARSTALMDEDLAVADICRSDLSLPYYECEPDSHHCTTSAFASVEARLAELVSRCEISPQNKKETSVSLVARSYPLAAAAVK